MSGTLILAARCYLVKRDFKTSRQYAARGLQLYPDNAGMYINMADIDWRQRIATGPSRSCGRV